MKYQDWNNAYTNVANSDPKYAAMRWNIDHENRINKIRGQFRRRLGYVFDQRCSDGLLPDDAARDALNLCIDETRPITSRWLGHLPVNAPNSLPQNGFYTHLTSNIVARYEYGSVLDPNNPPKQVRFNRPLATVKGINQPATRFIWVTFDNDNRPPPSDPTQVARELGLDHYITGSYVYRIFLPVSPNQSYIPTVLDAGCGPAWGPPPENHKEPWGLTRDLETGASSRPELLVETIDFLTERPIAELVSSVGARQQVMDINIDFLANRP